jgi:exosortase
VERARPIAWTLFGLLAAVAYAQVLSTLATTWWANDEYSHGLICAPLAAAIVFWRRRELGGLPAAPRLAGLAGALVSLGLLLAGTLGAELFLTRASFLLFAASAVVYLFGWRHLRALAFPFALVALSIPIPAILLTRVTLPLQFAASSTAETALTLFRIPVLREGNVLVLSNATLQVAEACSGVRSMMSLVVLALLVARYMEHRLALRVAIVAAAVPVTIAVNAVRVTATAVATEFYGVPAAEGIAHEMLGIVLFAVSAALLVSCARLLTSLTTMAPRFSLKALSW